MGLIAALNFTEGISKPKIAIMKLLLLTALAAVAMAEPEAEAGYYGLGYGCGHQLNWPGYYGHGFSSTCWGCRGKRSAEADAEPGYYGYGLGYYGHPYGYGYRACGPGIAAHPGYATSFTYRSPQGLRGKRSAEAEAEPAYYGLGYGYGLYRPYFGYRAYGPGIARHPSGTSFTYRSVQGFGK